MKYGAWIQGVLIEVEADNKKQAKDRICAKWSIRTGSVPARSRVVVFENCEGA